ncbi:hypothetical protein AURDEDRAFT_178683 [Auricularia subglabra TFB-10046 SS5]|uniref:Uncharacterized protein n=1 Tax=Auricularia subglabra (strain TFB-10046 / SS5) TaxID=717982 RepID=J0D129_AURST|nr:hypothetical protein AURDEDRAFT_178683 [Auricularia subglabra TFB-10046 SS5]
MVRISSFGHEPRTSCTISRLHAEPTSIATVFDDELERVRAHWLALPHVQPTLARPLIDGDHGHAMDVVGTTATSQSDPWACSSSPPIAATATDVVADIDNAVSIRRGDRCHMRTVWPALVTFRNGASDSSSPRAAIPVPPCSASRPERRL